MSFEKGTKIQLTVSHEKEVFPNDPVLFTMGKTYVSKGPNPYNPNHFLVDDDNGEESSVGVIGGLWEWEAVQE